jgi:hypothetical protein
LGGGDVAAPDPDGSAPCGASTGAGTLSGAAGAASAGAAPAAEAGAAAESAAGGSAGGVAEAAGGSAFATAWDASPGGAAAEPAATAAEAHTSTPARTTRIRTARLNRRIRACARHPGLGGRARQGVLASSGKAAYRSVASLDMQM